MGQVIVTGQLIESARTWHAQDLSIVLTNGCFDLMHIGHLRTFQEAKKFGDLLVVGINSDQSVRGLKGNSRPLVPQDYRAELVAALEPVDAAVIFDEATADELLLKLQPRIYVKGGDYTLENLPEAATIRRLGIQFKTIPLVAGLSTTELVRRIKSS